MTTPNPERLEDLINQLVVAWNFSLPDDLDLKIDLLTFTLDWFKHQRRSQAEHVTFEEFVQCAVEVDKEKLVITAPSSFYDVGTSLSAIQLQSPLLIFLLLYHRERSRC